MMAPVAFDLGALPSFKRRAASPALEETGIALAAPASVDAVLGGPLPVAGSFLFPALFVNRFHNVATQIAVVVVDATTHRAWSRQGFRRLRDTSPLKVDETDPDFEERTLGGWFNLDLYAIAPNLPRTAKRVLAYAFVGEIVSNVVDIRIGAGP